jgi:Cu(I)/Ag(I) efflux system membrane protein CusA/SilA
MIETIIRFKPESEWREGMTIESIREEIQRTVDLPGVTNAWVMPIKTRIDMLATGIKTPVGIKIGGPDLPVIQSVGADIEALLPQVQGTASVFAERVAGGRYVTVDIDRAAAARHGLNINDVQAVISSAIGGMNVSETIEGLERFPINVRYPQEVRGSIDTIRDLPVLTSEGERIRLGDVAQIEIEDGPPMIKSENSRPTGWVYVDIAERDIGSYVQAAQQHLAENLELPAGYSLTWSGQYEYMERAKERLTLVVPLTLLIIAFLLYLAFRRLGEVLIIMATLPMAIAGSSWLLWWLAFDLSVAVAVGFIALAGVAVEIGVIMLIYLNQYRARYLEQAQENGGASVEGLREAIAAGALQRLRPIVMTVAAITAGLLPIMQGHGTGGEIMKRIAAPMVGGMISTLVLTLLVLPAVYFLWQKWLLRAQLHK